MKKKLATWLLNWLNKPSNWKIGDKFTFVVWLSEIDTSWVGTECEITKMQGDSIQFKTLSGYKSEVNHRWFTIGKDMVIKPI